MDWIVDPGKDVVEISILNLLRNGGEYLGPSSAAKTNWIKNQHYFLAKRAPEIGETVYRIGPEVCNYLPPCTFVEIATKDGVVAVEQIEWPGVAAAPEAGGAIHWSTTPPSPPSTPAPSGPSLSSSLSQPSSAEPPSASPVKTTNAGTTEARPRHWQKLLLPLLGLAFAAGAYFTAKSLAPSRQGAPAAPAGDLEVEAFDAARACAVDDPCRASACTAAYRQTYPNGAHTGAIGRLETDASGLCEQNTFDRDASCASSKEGSGDWCQVAPCFKDYQTQFPGGRYARSASERVEQALRKCQAAEAAPPPATRRAEPAAASSTPEHPVVFGVLRLPQQPSAGDKAYTMRCTEHTCYASFVRRSQNLNDGGMREIDVVDWSWEVDSSRNPVAGTGVRTKLRKNLVVACANSDLAVFDGDIRVDIPDASKKPNARQIPAYDLWWAACRNKPAKFSRIN